MTNQILNIFMFILEYFLHHLLCLLLKFILYCELNIIAPSFIRKQFFFFLSNQTIFFNIVVLFILIRFLKPFLSLGLLSCHLLFYFIFFFLQLRFTFVLLILSLSFRCLFCILFSLEVIFLGLALDFIYFLKFWMEDTF